MVFASIAWRCHNEQFEFTCIRIPLPSQGSRDTRKGTSYVWEEETQGESTESLRTDYEHADQHTTSGPRRLPSICDRYEDALDVAHLGADQDPMYVLPCEVHQPCGGEH